MIRLTCWTFLLAVVSPIRLAAQATADVQLQSFDQAWEIVYTTHFDTTFNGVDWRGLRDSLRPRAIGAPRDTVRLLISTMLARLGQSHFSLMHEDLVDPQNAGRGTAVTGLEARLVEGQVVVTSVDSGSPADRAGIQAGWTITAVDSNRTDSLLLQLDRRTSRYALGVRVAGITGAWLAGDAGTATTVHLLDGVGRPVSHRLVREPALGEPVRFGDFPTFYARLTSRRLTPAGGPTVGLIWFNSWMVPLMRQLDSAVIAVQPADGMVLDLRGNRGGVGAMVMGVAGHFLDRRDTLGLFRSRTTNLAFVANPRRTAPDGTPVKPFAGPLAILLDELSGSASEVFAGGMQSLGRVRVFGATSMGGVLPAQWDRLPNRDVLYHAVADFVTGDGIVLEGRGVIPEEPISLRRAELLAGRDPVLDAAIRWITTVRSGAPRGETR